MADKLSPAMIDALRRYASGNVDPRTFDSRTDRALLDRELINGVNLTDAGRAALARVDGEPIKAGDVVRHTGRGMVKIGAFQHVTVTRVYELASRTRIDGREPSGADVIGAPVDQFKITERPAERPPSAVEGEILDRETPRETAMRVVTTVEAREEARATEVPAAWRTAPTFEPCGGAARTIRLTDRERRYLAEWLRTQMTDEAETLLLKLKD